MKRLLVVGAGFLQSFVIKKAKALGYYTLAIDKNPNSIGFSYADEYEAIDIVDQESCLRYAQSKSIDGVVTAATDYGVLTAAYIAQCMKLSGLNYEIAKVVKNKYKVRRILSKHNVDDMSQSYEINEINEIDEISYRIHFPVMVKPCDGSGSRAVRRVNSLEGLKDACNESMKASLMGKVLIEDFVEGREYGVESFVYNGQVYVLGVIGKCMTSPPDYAELGHCIPSKLAIEDKVKEVAKRAIEALGINFGAVNMDVIVTEDERVYIVDIGARMGGNLIGSHIIPIGTGIDYMGSLIRAAVNDSVDLSSKTSKKNVVTRILALTPGKVMNLPNFQEISQKCQVHIYHYLEKGSIIKEYHNNLDGCGYIVAVAGEIKEAERRARKAMCLIDAGIEREIV
jgi:biotin carboxylase